MVETGDIANWYRKWVILAGILGWLFLFRYRVMGWLLSKAATYQLAKSHSLNARIGPVTVQVERVSLQPLRVFNVEISSSGSTTFHLVFTKVEVQTQVKAFFESFGLVKICVLAIDRIIFDVDKVDDALLLDVLLPKKMAAKNVAASTRPKMNPICYMRFVDLKVESIRLRVNCLEMTTRFYCQGLYVGITDVFVQRDMLQLKAQVKSVLLHSSPQIDSQVVENNDIDDNDGLRVEFPDTSAVLDLNLRNQRFLGCKMVGSEEQTTIFVVSTAFLERALTARSEIIRKGLDVQRVRSGDPAVFSPVAITPSEIELDGFLVSVTVVNEVESVGSVPIQFCANVRKLKYLKQLVSSNAASIENIVSGTEVTERENDSEVRVQVETLVQNLRVHNLASNKKLLYVCSIQMQGKQKAKSRGVVAGTFDKIEIFLSHRSEKIFRSLLAAQQRVEKCQIEAKRMISSTLVKAPSGSASDQLAVQAKPGRINWDAEIEITSWMLSFKALAKGGGIDDFTAHGIATSIQTPMAPNLNENGSSFIKRCIDVHHVSVDVVPDGLKPHSAVFGGAKLTLSTTLDPSQGSKTIKTSVVFKHVSINGLLPEYDGEPSRFPAVYLHDFEVDREEKITAEITEVDMDIRIDNTDVKWNYVGHKAFLVECAALKNVIDQLDVLISSTSKKPRVVQSDQPRSKIVGTNVYSKETLINVVDIPGVAALATFCLDDTKINHRSTQLSVTTTLNSANASIRWGQNPSTIILTDASVQSRRCLGRQMHLTKIPIQSDIRCSTLKIHLRPRSRMLLLFLRLDQLISKSSEKSDVEKRPTIVQGISFVCGAFAVELDREEATDEKATIEFATFSVKMTRCTPREITETMVRLAQCLGKEGLAGRSFADVARQVMILEGTASASAISAAIPLKKLVELQDTEIRFSLTDVEWSRSLSWGDGVIVPRTTSFDFSILTDKAQLAMERKPFEALLQVVPFLQEAFDTKEPRTDDNVEANPEQPNFRQRFVGNLDIALHNAELTCPYGDKDGREQIGRKVTRALLGDVVFNLRQFQVLELKFAPVLVMLEDADSSGKTEKGVSRGEDSLQLLFVPKVSMHSVIHWMHGIHHNGQLDFALSLEVAIGNTHSYDQPTHVPIADETLVAMNWDCVYPWLIYMTTDEYGDPVVKSTQKTDGDTKRIQCVGVQWDLSVSLVQFAWWDMATQDTGMLIVANEFLTHGVIRRDTSSDLFELEQSGRHQWILWEATVYLHLFRGYLLHSESDFMYGEGTTPEVIPFGSEMVSNFSLETVGTSYRKTYTPVEDEDWEALDDEIAAMFAPSNTNIFEKLHESFVPIDYEFGISRNSKPYKQETSMGNLPMLHVSPSVRTSFATTFPPKSPRSAKNWTQNIKNRLLRINRRSASMDNLFLKDGSCPIQVDSMKLLWTIQTRDCVFYMVATTVDNLRLLLDAQRNASKVDGLSDVTRVAPISPSRGVKRSSFRSPSVVSSNTDVATGDPRLKIPPFINRRGSSTRDTLLDLLQQGKLGMTQDSDQESSSKSLDDDSSSTRDSIGEDTNDFEIPKVMIAMKAYTVDIHDAQINVREENTRSNMLLASKHIHFEIGTDAGETNTIANLTFDNVTAHVAPIDVDISAGVLWYSQSDVGSHSASTLLKQIMDECSLTSSYTHACATGATSTEVDLSFLQLSSDRHQFYQLMNVIRHVLLAPPSAAKRPKRAYTPKPGSTESSQQQPILEGSDITVFKPPSSTTNALTAPISTKKLHMLLEEELRNREIRTRGTASRSKPPAMKAISFNVVGLQWRLRLSPEITGSDHEFVGIRIQGFTGCHTYFTNHCTKLTLNLQWLEISNMQPGPSSAAFEDPTAVLKAKLLVDKRLESSSKLTAGNQKGMLVVRAESGPIVRVHGQKLRVLEVLEVSMFPEVSNMIVIQLASDFYELIYKFFFEKISPTSSSTQNSEQVFFGRKSTYGATSPTTSSNSLIPGQKGVSSPFTKSRAPPTSPQSSLRSRKSNSSGSMNSTFADLSSSAGSNSPTSASASEEPPDESESAAPDDCELFYVKYVRVGNVRLRINCNGFFVNLSHFDLDLPPYVCQSKLCTTKKLLQKFESHLKWYITKESASSGLSQFKNKLLKWTPSSPSDKKDKSKKQEEDTATANAQVLFGPYSGTST